MDVHDKLSVEESTLKEINHYNKSALTITVKFSAIDEISLYNSDEISLNGAIDVDLVHEDANAF